MSSSVSSWPFVKSMGTSASSKRSTSSPFRSGTWVPWPAYWNTSWSPARLSSTSEVSASSIRARVASRLRSVFTVNPAFSRRASQARLSFTQPLSGMVG